MRWSSSAAARAREPNSKATEIELYDGLSRDEPELLALARRSTSARSPSFFAPLLPAGFYYKTFMWPPAFWELLYEPLIRRAAGLGRAPTEPDPDRYEHTMRPLRRACRRRRPPGLRPRLAAGRRRRTRHPRRRAAPSPGGSLARGARQRSATKSAATGSPRMVARLDAFPDVTAARPHDSLRLLRPQPGRAPRAASPITARLGRASRASGCGTCARGRVVLATGAHERSLIFDDNDRPGVMLASAARALRQSLRREARTTRRRLHQQRLRL